MTTATPSIIATEWQIALAQASLPMSLRDPVIVRRACERMDRTREELRRRIGTVEVAVEFVRDARDR